MCDWKKEFKELLFSSADKEAKRQAFDLKEKNIPTQLFRYRPLNAYTLLELANETVYIQSPLNFNDPYDSWTKFSAMAGIRDNSSKKIFKDALLPHYPENQLDEIFKSPDWFENLYELVFQSTGIDVLNVALQPTLEALNQKAATTGQQIMKVCCFTEVNNSLAMWAHYADEYAGICVEYDMTRFQCEDIQRTRMFPVFYDAELADYTDYFLNNSFSPKKDIFLEGSLHKLSEWSYEREWRFNIGNGVFDEDVNYQFPAISSIYMGYRLPDKYKASLLNIAQVKKYSLNTMKIMSYGIDYDTVYEP